MDTPKPIKTIHPQTTVALISFCNIVKDHKSITSKIYKAIENLHSNGYTTFICPVAPGYYFLAAEMLLKAKHRYPRISVIALVAAMDRNKLNAELQMQLDTILRSADFVLFISKNITNGIFSDYHKDILVNVNAIIYHHSRSNFPLKNLPSDNTQIIDIFE